MGVVAQERNKPYSMQKMDSITLELETITPSCAKNLLLKQVHSRILKHRKVESYAKAMRGKMWFLSCDAIELDSDEQVLDGMHRLMACVKADTPFKSKVIRNANREGRYHDWSQTRCDF